MTSTGSRPTFDSVGRPRPKTADQAKSPILKEQIPHYRLGSTRFSTHGTAFLHSSIYTQTTSTDGLRSSALSQAADLNKVFPMSPPCAHFASVAPALPLLPQAVPLRQDLPNISPRVYDDLTFPPAADDPSIVRYSPTTGSVIAATVPRLVAQITSPNFLDYDLLSDFFLTFRSFLAPFDLVDHLMARLAWAATRSDEVGKIVTVRTFVALRHWILNYFVDDFVPNLTLRRHFCSTLNTLCASLRNPGAGGVVTECKVIGELKRCWRRTCALYWDDPYASDHGSCADDMLLPGGAPGSRDSQAPLASYVGRPTVDAVPAHIDAVLARDQAPRLADVPSAVYRKTSLRVEPMASIASRSRLHQHTVADPKTRAKSLSSELSSPVLSCSIPARGLKRAAQAMINHHASHPADGQHPPAHLLPHAAANPRPPSASSRPITARPLHGHKRSGSFSDALRDRRVPLPQPKADAEPPQVLVAIPVAGSLIRGHGIPPASATVHLSPPAAPASKATPGFISNGRREEKTTIYEKPSASALHAPGMRKLFGSVRRVLHYRDVLDLAASTVEPSRLAQSSADGLPPGAGTVSRGGSSATAKADDALTTVDFLAASIWDDLKTAANDNRALDAKFPHRFVQNVPSDGHPMASSQALRTPVSNSSPVFPPGPSPATEDTTSVFIRPSGGAPPPSLISEGAQSPLQIPPPVTTHPSSIIGKVQPPARYSTISSAGSSARTLSRYSTRRSRRGLRRSASAGLPASSNDIASSSSLSHISRPPAVTAARAQSRVKPPSIATSVHASSSLKSRTASSYTDRSPDSTIMAESDNNQPGGIQYPSSTRMLRRRPGGDLRAAKKVADLRQHARPRSAGSLTARSESICSSILRTTAGSRGPSAVEDDNFGSRSRRYSLGTLSETDHGPSISLIQTHSSQPNLRPSFESEVARLAQLPDDDEDDGGIESTLLKLEGRFERRPSADVSSRGDAPTPTMPKMRTSAFKADPGLSQADRNDATVENDLPGASSMQKDPYVHAIFAASIVDSDYSYSSTPILERGLSNKSLERRHARRTRSTASLPPPLSRPSRRPEPGPSTPAYGSAVSRKSTPQALPVKAGAPRSSMAQASFLLDDDGPPESFLLDDDQDLSDLSSEMSADMADSAEDSVGPSGVSPRSMSGADVVNVGLPFHPFRHPPSPPPSDRVSPTQGAAQVGPLSCHPPSPIPSPTHNLQGAGMPVTQYTQPHNRGGPDGRGQLSPPHDPRWRHAPFILEYSSEILAEQFTLLEKDALNEIDWKELVDLRATQTSLDTRNWFRFLQSPNARGVSLVIARFNVIAKWALSEVVLTQDIEERARTISKYIHIAAHARRLRNFATMYQLMTALISTDCARLRQTWDLVPDADVAMARELELLVQPVRNFQHLRVEMETTTASDGCIPFLGMPHTSLLRLSYLLVTFFFGRARSWLTATSRYIYA